MSTADREKWNQIYLGERDASHAARVLLDNMYLLPARGVALDLACGLGANTLELARAGLEVSGWDCSDVALDKLGHRARQLDLKVSLQLRDVIAYPPAPSSFDVIIVVHFLDRSLVPHIIQALRPDGLVFYQTFTREKIDDSGPRNPGYLLAPNELLGLFSGLKILYYREDGRTGDLSRGIRNEAMLIARKG
jgi:SAM-dependent methyltransferase